MQETDTFESLGVSPETSAALSRMGIIIPTAVQLKTIPDMLDWADIMAKAPTGTGKTCAFGIPIIEHIDSEIQDVQALVLSPTRELALQIAHDLQNLAFGRPYIRMAVLYGGQAISKQLEQLHQKPQIIVATPGRLMDHMQRRTVHIQTAHTVCTG